MFFSSRMRQVLGFVWVRSIVLLATALATALALIACLPVRVTTETAPGVDVSQLVSFVQAPPPPQDPTMPLYTPEIGARLSAEIAQALAAKGYRRVDEGGDFELRFLIKRVEGEKLVNAGDPDADYYILRPYVDGTVTILVLDPKTREPLWQGSGETQVFTSGAIPRPNLDEVAADTARSVIDRLPDAATP